MKKQIIAIGGGGFSMEANLALDQYILDQCNNSRPRICFLGTASGDAQSYIDKFYNAYKKLKCRPSHLSLFKPFTADIESFLLHQHAIFVGGGNTKSMLAIWREWGVDRILEAAYQKGIVLSGISAGSICWFDQGITDSIPGKLSLLKCLSILEGTNCPHYDGESKRRPTLEKMIVNGDIVSAVAADDGAAIHYIDGEIKNVVSSVKDVKAYVVTKDGNDAKEEPLKVTFLNPISPIHPHTSRTFTNTPWESKVGYCRAIKSGNQIFVTGTAPVTDDGSTFAPNDGYRQACRCFELIKKALTELGADLSNVVRTRMFVTDISLWKQFGQAHNEYFSAHPPATTMVEVKALIDPEMLIEVEADAILKE